MAVLEYTFCTINSCYLFKHIRSSLMVQWLRLSSFNAGDMGSIPGWETKILHAV